MSTGALMVLNTFKGIQAQRATTEEAKHVREQAALLDFEAREEAGKVESDADSFRQRQKMLFLKSGLSLEGSPLLILEKTQKIAEEEADAIRARGSAKFNLGMRQGDRLRRQGRAALIGSFLETSPDVFSSIKKEVKKK